MYFVDIMTSDKFATFYDFKDGYLVGIIVIGN